MLRSWLGFHLKADGVAKQPLVALFEVHDRDGQAQQQLRHLPYMSPIGTATNTPNHLWVTEVLQE